MSPYTGDMDYTHLPREELAQLYDGSVFLHYKGGIYRFLHIAKHTETGEALVIYEHLFPHVNSVFARPLEEFIDFVVVDGQMVDRFKPISACAMTKLRILRSEQAAIPADDIALPPPPKSITRVG